MRCLDAVQIVGQSPQLARLATKSDIAVMTNQVSARIACTVDSVEKTSLVDEQLLGPGPIRQL